MPPAFCRAALVDIAFNICLQMGETAGDLVPGEVPVAVVHHFEFAAVGADAIALQHDQRISSETPKEWSGLPVVRFST